MLHNYHVALLEPRTTTHDNDLKQARSLLGEFFLKSHPTLWVTEHAGAAGCLEHDDPCT